MSLKRSKIKQLLQDTPINEQVLVKGWVRTKRGSKNVAFIALNDGSVIHNLQIVAEPDAIGEEILRKVTTGACISVQGQLVASQGSGQKVELLSSKIEILKN